MLFQIGITCFFPSDSTGTYTNHFSYIRKWTAKPYSVYLYPECKPSSNYETQSYYCCDVWALRFLVKEATFDLNRCILNGVSFLSQEKEKEYRKMLDTKYKPSNSSTKINHLSNKFEEERDGVVLADIKSKVYIETNIFLSK